MKFQIDERFRELCREIVGDAEAGTLVDSDDLYQCANFCGGWDGEDGRLHFSFYAPDGGDYIFSMSVDDARLVASGREIDPPMERWKDAPPW